MLSCWQGVPLCGTRGWLRATVLALSLATGRWVGWRKVTCKNCLSKRAK